MIKIGGIGCYGARQRGSAGRGCMSAPTGTLGRKSSVAVESGRETSSTHDRRPFMRAPRGAGVLERRRLAAAAAGLFRTSEAAGPLATGALLAALLSQFIGVGLQGSREGGRGRGRG